MDQLDNLLKTLTTGSPEYNALKRLMALPESVKTVRECQKAYFKSRNYLILERSKRLEKDLDDTVESLLKTKPTQIDPTLFN